LAGNLLKNGVFDGFRGAIRAFWGGGWYFASFILHAMDVFWVNILVTVCSLFCGAREAFQQFSGSAFQLRAKALDGRRPRRVEKI
jgi:hypothetical protein